MNIEDIKIDKLDKVVDGIHAIYKKQRELVEKYKDIEGLPDYPFDIDVADNQIWIKDFAWRTVEELSESYECIDDTDDMHFKEELIDALHFATEMLILCNIKPSQVMSIDDFETCTIIKDNMAKEFWDVTYNFGILCNCLKNKKWKQTQILTDKNKFNKLLITSYNSLLGLLNKAGMSGTEIYLFYCKKNEVNKFRQRSKY